MTAPNPPVPTEPAAPVPAPVAPVVAPVAPTASRAALRAYLLGLVAAVLGAAIPIVQASLGAVQWSAAWWQALGIAVFVPAISAGLAYLAHTKFPPGQ